jgi:transposase-like protein
MKELDGFEKAVHRSRLAIFRLAVSEGMNYSDLARAWGVSRQRISALMKEL